MRVTPSIMAIGLAPIIALAGCEESAAGPAHEALNPTYAVSSPTAPGNITPDLPGPRGPAEILALSGDLGLSAEQRAAIEAIAEELEALNEPLWEEMRGGQPGASGPPQGNQGPRLDPDNPIMQEIRDNTRSAMHDAMALLTDEQARLFEELRDTQGPGIAGRMAPPSGLDPGSAILGLADELDLTQAQIDAIDAILAAGLRGPEARAAIEGVLTSEQLEILRSILADRRGPVPGPGTP